MGCGQQPSRTRSSAERFGVRFPPDLLELLTERRPADGYDWAGQDSRRIRKMLSWPLEMLIWDVNNGSWWNGWGERPRDKLSRREIVRDAVGQAPRLIPLIGHRFIPEAPSERGNPVFSMYGLDTIYYGANLIEYFTNEFGGAYKIGEVRRVPFWSALAEQA